LVCFAIFGRFLGFGGKRFSRENVPEMTELEGFLLKWKNWRKMGKRGKTAIPLAPVSSSLCSSSRWYQNQVSDDMKASHSV